jgi:uncharacterized protein (TIGR02266 family)
MDNERRSNSRVAVELSVELRTSDGRTSTTDRILNISLGGVFLEMPEPLDFGSEVDLRFVLPVAPREVSCRALVVWNSNTHPERCPGLSGIGLRLMEIGNSEMRVLNQFIDGQLSF